jgi:hypothetical protein
VKWVQCENCAKWRRLPDHVDIKALSDKMWYCHMNEFDPL